MAWTGLIRVWDNRTSSYRRLTVRIEDTAQPGCLIKVYEGEKVVDEEFADSPQVALHRALEMARHYLQNPCITEDALDWVQI